MSWQGNDLFAMVLEHEYEKCEPHMLEVMESLLDIYDAHGRGWYLLGGFECDDEEDYDPFEPSMPYCWCWLPNPFMAPGVMALRIRNASDLIGAAYECWDSHYEIAAYAGDGEEPLQHMVIRGIEYDLR